MTPDSLGDTSGANLRKSTVVLILSLSIAIWAFFYAKDMPLKPGETVLVVGVCAVVVLSGKWLWNRLGRGRAKT